MKKIINQSLLIFTSDVFSSVCPNFSYVCEVLKTLGGF